MLKLLIVADDFTGALDTGVQFAELGAAVKVVTSPQYDLPASANLDVLESWRMFWGITENTKSLTICPNSW